MTTATNPPDTLTQTRTSLYDRFAARIAVEDGLSRKLVSYQGNKHVPGLRWMKYKEGFSAKISSQLPGSD